MGTRILSVCFMLAIAAAVIGCDPPPTCDTSLKHLPNILNNNQTSFWYQPIASTPALLPNSADVISHMYSVTTNDLFVSIGDYGRLIYYMDSSNGGAKTNYITGLIYNGKTSGGPIRWRSCISAAAGTDGHSFVLDETDQCAYEFWGLNKNGNKTAYNMAALPFSDPDGMYNNPHTSSAGTAMGVCAYIGEVWPDEVTSTVNHAYWFCFFGEHINLNGGMHVSPACHGDGLETARSCYDVDPIEGMQFQMNASYDISGWASYQRPIGQALKTYGMYCGNMGGNMNLNGVSKQGYTNNCWSGILPDPDAASFPVPVKINQFRVLAIPGYTTSPGRHADTTCLTYQPSGGTLMTLSSISPASGPDAGGTTVTLNGSGFNSATSVKFFNTAATNFNRVSDSMITCTAPAKTYYSLVDVRAVGGTNTISTGAMYQYGAGGTTPTLSSINPSSGTTAGGTACTLTGANLTGCSAVSFGGTAGTGIVVDSSTQVRCTSPAKSAGTISVTATTSNGTSNGVSYTYSAPAGPTLSAINPSSGTTAGGTACTLTGANLTGCSAVSFGGTAGTGIVVDSSTQVRCTSPAKSAGTYSVTATTPNGTSNGVNYTYTAGGTSYTTTLATPADARVLSSSAGTNYGTIITLYVQKNASTENASYIKWDLNSVQGTTITSAKLRLYRAAGTATTNKVYSCATDTWIESGTGSITWTNKPAWGTQQASFAVAAAAGYNEVDVTSYVSANFNGDKLVTMVIRDDQNLNVQCAYNSDENSSNKPQLVVISQ